MSSEELQQEEREVLLSIYDGDTAFKQISDTVFQYKIGEDGANKSFITEISWHENYPEELPEINFDLFYNKHVDPSLKEAAREGLIEQANDLLGLSMTFTLFEWIKDSAEQLLEKQPDAPIITSHQIINVKESTEEADEGKVVKEKKEHLTKSQKRRMLDRFGANSDRPRGWDWVDIIKHLSQTGKQELTE